MIKYINEEQLKRDVAAMTDEQKERRAIELMGRALISKDPKNFEESVRYTELALELAAITLSDEELKPYRQEAANE